MGWWAGEDGAGDGSVDVGLVDVGSGAGEVFVGVAEQLAWEGERGKSHCGVCGGDGDVGRRRSIGR